MALLYTDAKTAQEKVVDIITSSAILDNVKSAFLLESREKLSCAYCKIAKKHTRLKCEECRSEEIDEIAIIAEIYPNRKYCGNRAAKNFEGQLRLIAAIRNEFAHDERFAALLEQDWIKADKAIDAILADLDDGTEELDIDSLNHELCNLFTRAGKKKDDRKKDAKTAKNCIRAISLDNLYLLFDYAFNQIRNFVCMYRYDGPERDEYLFGIREEMK